MMKFYAVRRKGELTFSCESKTREGMEKKADMLYNCAKGMSNKSADYNKETFWIDKIRVRVTVEEVF